MLAEDPRRLRRDGMTTEGDFVWYELVTEDSDAAADYYGKVIGWSMEDSGIPGMRYTLAKVGDRQVAGLMDFPPEMAVKRPAWLGYILVADVDAMAEKVKQAGGSVHREPADIPEVGRFAVVADPLGAVFMLFRGEGTPPPEVAMGSPGRLDWHELHSSDWEKAFAFYEGLFGWKKDNAVDMGGMGTYQTFTIGGAPRGGMMNNPQAPHSFWLYYAFTNDIDAAADRITAHGGKLMQQPMEVPGGMWVVQAFDPQGAMFALVGKRNG
jgi:predicted enzyme related to lactoylglutathione lyase